MKRAKPINFVGANSVTVMIPEISQTDRGIVPICAQGPWNISCWQFTAEEIEEIKKTGNVWLAVAGPSVPTLYVSGECPFEVVEEPPILDVEAEIRESDTEITVLEDDEDA